MSTDAACRRIDAVVRTAVVRHTSPRPMESLSETQGARSSAETEDGEQI